MTSPDSEPAELVFPVGLPGFESLRRFALARWGELDSAYSRLVALEAPSTAFLVAPPEEFFDDYDVVVEDDDAELLQLQDAEDALVLVVITVGERAEQATANLLGPLVINTRLRLGAQLVLPDERAGHGTRVPLVAG